MELHTVNIGKNGLTENSINEVMKVLKQKRMVKVKFLKSFISSKSHEEKKKLFEELAEKANAKVEQQVGFVVVLKK